MPLLPDNLWHEAIMVPLTDGTLGIYESFEEAEKRDLPRIPTPNAEWFHVQYNWNRGQPLLKFDNGKTGSIVDINFQTEGKPGQQSGELGA